MRHLRNIKEELIVLGASRPQRSRFNTVNLQHKGNWVSDTTHKYILYGGEFPTIEESLSWLPERNPLATAETGFYYLKPFSNTDHVNVTQKDGINLGYTYNEIIDKLTETYLKDNYTKAIDGITLQTERVFGQQYRVNYTVYSHNITEDEELFKYKLHSEEFPSLDTAVARVLVLKAQTLSPSTPGEVVSVNYDTNAVRIFKKYTKYIPIASSFESLGRSLQKSLGYGGVVRLTWLVRKEQNQDNIL